MKSAKNILFGAFLLFVTPVYAQRAPMDLTKNVGVETCRDCHEEMVLEWEGSAHARSFTELASSPNAAEMAAILQIKPAEIPTTASCVRCHYTQEFLASVPQTTSAVGCESCHGSAIDWIEDHNNKGFSREQRVTVSTEKGMAHPENIGMVSRSCYECHVIDDEQLVNMAGHPAISDDFEILSWYSGEVKHNFLVSKSGSSRKSHTDDLQPIPQERKRMLYLNGKLLHLAYSLKAVACSQDAPVDKKGDFIRLSNGRYTFAVQHALEIDRITKDLRMVLKKLSIPQYADALAIVRGLSLKTGHREEIDEAAEELFRLSEVFCRENDGSGFGAIDGILAELKPRYSKKEGIAGAKPAKPKPSWQELKAASKQIAEADSESGAEGVGEAAPEKVSPSLEAPLKRDDVPVQLIGDAGGLDE